MVCGAYITILEVKAWGWAFLTIMLCFGIVSLISRRKCSVQRFSQLLVQLILGAISLITLSLWRAQNLKKHKHSCNHKCTLLRKLLFLFLRDSAEPCVTENRCFGNQYLRCSGYLLRLPCHGWGQIHCSPHRWPRSSCLHFHDSNSRHQWLLRQLLEHLKKDAGRNMSRLYVV